MEMHNVFALPRDIVTMSSCGINDSKICCIFMEILSDHILAEDILTLFCCDLTDTKIYCIENGGIQC
jgi:hypothetical protein